MYDSCFDGIMPGGRPRIGNNRVVDVTFSYSGPITEPVTLDEVKTYIRKDFPDDDTDVLPDMITAAREWAEETAGITIVNRRITAVLEVFNRQELPYGPVITIQDATKYHLQGSLFPRVIGNGEITLTYDAGYGTSVPESIKLAIMAKVASTDAHRGDEDKQHYAEIAHQLLAPYNRVLWI